ncbi:hypothetical protein C6P45_004351 [Maudiozyma exigua]|uniref:Uncharacterized protein n=1 Tax=Maudiozyma exigua TaxID=34358 RepID=A0A9P7BBU6_MAUEX|nr:hypothetical protein C6P45_004351 [Kazachstania exigua]
MLNNFNRNLITTLNKEMLDQDTISTPIKSNQTLNHSASEISMDQYGSSPFTPHSSDNLFQSVPRMNILSSPPSNNNALSHKNQRVSNPSTPLKLSLTIGANGKASIVSPHIFKHLPLKPSSPDVTNVQTTEKLKSKTNATNGAALPEKTKILNLLKKMRSTTSSLNSSPTKNKIKKPLHKNKHTELTDSTNRVRRASVTLNEITNKLPVPQVTVSSTPVAPSTPRSKNVQFRTGFTPSVGLDVVLSNSMSPRMFFNNGSSNDSSLDDRILKFSSPSTTFSPKTRLLPKPSTSHAYQQQLQQQQFPFKYSGGDPLLINDVENGHWFEVMNNNGHTAQGSMGSPAPSAALLLASPKANITSFASPQSIDKRLKPVSLNEKTKLQMEPATPNETASNAVSLQFTPLIQQTMNGSLSNKIVASSIAMSPIGTTTSHNTITHSTNVSSSEKDDAVSSLKKLINRS